MATINAGKMLKRVQHDKRNCHCERIFGRATVSVANPARKVERDVTPATTRIIQDSESEAIQKKTVIPYSDTESDKRPHSPCTDRHCEECNDEAIQKTPTLNGNNKRW